MTLHQNSSFLPVWLNQIKELWNFCLYFDRLKLEFDCLRQKISFILHKYRVSHSKEGKVILLWWGFRFWFLLTFLVLHVHEKGTFLLNSSVFIFLMLRALYRMICKNAKSFFGKNSLNVSNVKLFSNFFFSTFLAFLCLFGGNDSLHFTY